MNRKTKKLIKKLRSENYNDKVRAAEELGKTGDPEAINPLIETLEEVLRNRNAYPNLELGIKIAKSLTLLGVDHTNTLKEFLNSHNPIDVVRAAIALGELRRKDAIECLLAKLNNRDPLVRSHVILALGEIGEADKKVVETLRSLAANDLDGYVRKRAKEALEKLAKEKELLEVEVVPAKGGKSYVLKVNSKITVKLFKKQVGKLMHVKDSKIILSLEGKTLDDNLTLLEGGVKNKSKLYVIRLP